jgi:hypothetical protein
MSFLFNRAVFLTFFLVVSLQSASAEVCDKGDFEDAPWFVMAGATVAIFFIFVLPIILAIAAIWRAMPKLSLALSAYASIFVVIFALEWREVNSQTISSFDQMVLEGCASYAFQFISVAVLFFLAFAMFINYCRSRKLLYGGR